MGLRATSRTSKAGNGSSIATGMLQLAAGVPLDTTLRAVTDQAGTSSPLQLSTTLAKFSTNLILGGATSASARLHVRGDGTNPVARFETSAGAETHIFRDNSQLQFGSQSNYISSTANGTSSSVAGRGLLFVGASGQGIHLFNFVSSNSETSGTVGGINISASYGAASGSALHQPLRIAYTINNSGTVSGTATGIYLRATQTNLNGMSHNFLDLGTVAGGSLFRIKNDGTLFSTLQTGNAGLVTGETYKDTAANILANGDYVMGIKA